MVLPSALRHLDARLAEHLAEQFVQQMDEGQRVSLRSVQGDPRAMVKLLAAARKAKEVLSTNTEARVQVNGLLPGHDFVAVVSSSSSSSRSGTGCFVLPLSLFLLPCSLRS